MNTGTAETHGRGQGQRFGRLAGVAALAVSLALVVVPSASAGTAAAVATVAPIDSAATGNYLLTVTNTGEQPITNFSFGGGNGVAVAPAGCTYNQPLPGTTGCPGIEPKSTMQVCYTGESSPGVIAFFSEANPIEIKPALVGTASACPQPGFNPPPKTIPGTNGGGGGGGAAATATLSLGKVKYKAKKGIATLVVNVTGAGSLKLTGKGVKTSTTSAKAAGSFTFTVQAGGKAAAKLNKTGKATLKVSVTFTPTGGSPITESKTVKLIKG